MDGDRTLWGGIGAAVGAVCAYWLAWWRGRHTRREVALLRKLVKGQSADISRDLDGRYAALRREYGDD